MQALDPDGRVDFPTVTEVCEAVSGNSEEMTTVAGLLSAALQRSCGDLEESVVSLQLKALTVINELLYDADARQALIDAPGSLSCTPNKN